MNFKCIHCENDDLKYFKFNSLNYQSEHWKRMPYQPSKDYESTPKIPIGIHIRCSKCDKDSFYIPENYGFTEWGTDIPSQCIVNVKQEVPEFSAIIYVLNADGMLDKLVKTSEGQILSIITQNVILDISDFTIITKRQYESLLTKGLLEVKNEPRTIISNIRKTESSTNAGYVELNDTRTEKS